VGPLTAVGAAICTVGDAIEERVPRSLDLRELPLAVMLDSVGSAAVESLAEYVNDLLCQVGIGEAVRSPTGSAPAMPAGIPPSSARCFRLCGGRADRRPPERGVLS
jgi:hypothetical protein